jgi:hypothetical protein
MMCWANPQETKFLGKSKFWGKSANQYSSHSQRQSHLSLLLFKMSMWPVNKAGINIPYYITLHLVRNENNI